MSPDPVTAPDYLDAFELHWSAPDSHHTLQWLRAGLEGAPRPLRIAIVVAHRLILGFRLGPLDSDAHVLGWRITSDAPNRTVLESRSRLYDGVITALRADPTTAVLVTSLRYRRPVPARVIWALTGPVHRAVAPYLLARAADTLGISGRRRPHRTAVGTDPG